MTQVKPKKAALIFPSQRCDFRKTAALHPDKALYLLSPVAHLSGILSGCVYSGVLGGVVGEPAFPAQILIHGYQLSNWSQGGRDNLSRLMTALEMCFWSIRE